MKRTRAALPLALLATLALRPGPARPSSCEDDAAGAIAGRLDAFFGGRRELVVAQRLENLEIVTGVETRNAYDVLDAGDPGGARLGSVVELGKGFWSAVRRQLFRTHRPMDIAVFDGDGEEVMGLRRPFHWFFSKIKASSGELQLGSVRRRFSLLNRKYDVCRPDGSQVGLIKGPVWRPWTFRLFDGQGQQVGSVVKQWRGVGTEVFSDADSFRVRVPDGWMGVDKALLLAAALSIDFDCFEGRG